MYLINKIEWKSFILRLIVLVDFVTGGDGGEAVEGWLHCERWGVSQLLRSRESGLPGRHQKGVSNSTWHMTLKHKRTNNILTSNRAVEWYLRPNYCFNKCWDFLIAHLLACNNLISFRWLWVFSEKMRLVSMTNNCKLYQWLIDIISEVVKKD